MLYAAVMNFMEKVAYLHVGKISKRTNYAKVCGWKINSFPGKLSNTLQYIEL